MTRLSKVWIFGDLWCSIWLAVDVWMCTASILNLCAISLDRYLAVTRPVSYPQASTIYWLFDFVAQVCSHGNARWSHLSPPGSSLLFCSSVSIHDVPLSDVSPSKGLIGRSSVQFATFDFRGCFVVAILSRVIWIEIKIEFLLYVPVEIFGRM